MGGSSQGQPFGFGGGLAFQSGGEQRDLGRRFFRARIVVVFFTRFCFVDDEPDDGLVVVFERIR